MADIETNNKAKDIGQPLKPKDKKDKTTLIILSGVLILIVIVIGILLWKTNILKTKPKQLALISGSGPAIIVGNKTISKAELNKQLNLQVALLRQFFATQGKPFNPYSKSSIGIINRLKKNVIQGLITLNLLGSYAKKNGITVNSAQVNDTITALDKRFGKAKFAAILNKSGMSLNEIKQQIKGQLMARAIFTDIMSKTKISDQDAKRFYQQHKSKFNIPEEVNARHILVKTKAKAEQIQKELKAGQPFTKLAMENSIDKASAARGGDLGFFKMGQMVPAFSKAAFALKRPGQISPIVKTQYGYHIIQLIAKKSGHIRNFAEVKPQLKQMLARQAAESKLQKIIKGLKAKTKIEIKVQ